MFYNSPAGCIKIKISGSFINEITFIKKEEEQTTPPITLPVESKKIFKKCTLQLDEYFSGDRKNFELPIRQEGVLTNTFPALNPISIQVSKL